MVTRLLNVCGMDLGRAEHILPAVELDNPAGYWENIEFVSLNERLLAELDGDWKNPPEQELLDFSNSERWQPYYNVADVLVKNEFRQSFYGWKDPRTSLTIKFWRQAVPGLRVVLCLRKPTEVAHSLNTGFVNRTVPFNDGIDLWRRYNANVVDSVPEDQLVVTDYNQYFDQPRQALSGLLIGLGLSIPEKKISRAVDTIKQAYRHQHDKTPVDADPKKVANARRLHARLVARVAA